MRNNSYVILVASAICFSSICCKKDISAPLVNNTPSNFAQIFENFWSQMNVNYVYWDIDSTNWDHMYQVYKPLFARLNLNDQKDVDTGVTYLKQITSGLVDAHYLINFTNGFGVGQSIYPALNRKLSGSAFHGAFRYADIDTNYLDKGFYSGYYVTSDRKRLSLIAGTIHHSVLYFQCDDFELEEAWQSPVDNSVKTVLSWFFSKLQDTASVRGLVIDVRNNSGGNIADLNFLVGRLIKQPLHFGYTRYKAGNNRLDYTPWIDAIVVPKLNVQFFSKPVVVLADNFSASLAEAVTMAIKALPGSYFVGETTWGATGPLTANEVYNDGSFNVNGFMTVKTSSAEFKYIDGHMYEGKGFSPDINVPFDLGRLQVGHDHILDTAISLIH